jgi:hypothetical protein
VAVNPILFRRLRPRPNAPVQADAKVQNAGNNQKAAAAGGLASTIGTSSQGITGSANTAGKSLLGQ